MTSEEIRSAIAANPLLQGLVPNTEAIASSLSQGRTRPNGRELGNGTILETVGLTAGNALLDVLMRDNPASQFRHVKPLLEQGRLIVSSALVTQTLQAMVPTVLTQEQAESLIALGQDPDPVSEFDVRRAIYNDDESLAV